MFTLTTTHQYHHHPPSPVLAPRWHISSLLPSRLLVRSVRLLLLMLAMFTLPLFIHAIVRCFDDLQVLLGRQARSPFEGEKLGGVGVGGVLVLVWHVWLVRLSYYAVLDREETERRGEEEEEEGKGGVSWGKVLGRIVVPGLLVWFGWRFGNEVAWRVGNPRVVMAGNVDAEGDGALLFRGYGIE